MRLFDGYLAINWCNTPTTLYLNDVHFASQNWYNFDRETDEVPEGNVAQLTSDENQELQV